MFQLKSFISLSDWKCSSMPILETMGRHHCEYCEQSEFLLSDYGVLTMVATDPNTGCFINDQVSLLLTDNPITSLVVFA